MYYLNFYSYIIFFFYCTSIIDENENSGKPGDMA